MSVSKMKKLLVVAPTDSADAVIKKLISLRCIDIRDALDCDGADILSRSDCDDNIVAIEERISKIEAVRTAILNSAHKKRGRFDKRAYVDRDEFISSGAYETALATVDTVYARLDESDLSEYIGELEKIEVLYDIEKTELCAAEIMGKSAHSKACTFISGWVPQKSLVSVETALCEYLCAYELCDPCEDDEPPVRLSGNVITRCFEWITSDYALPKYRAFDPTLLMSIFCFIAFGLMLCDVGYGLILIPLGFVLPKVLGARGRIKSAMNMLGICGISSVIFGILFGGWFGNLPYAIMQEMLWERTPELVAPVFGGVLYRPVEKPLWYLATVLGFGAIQIVVGMLIKFISLCKEGKAKDALFDILPWWVIFAGIVLAFAVNIIVGIAVAVVGVIFILIFAGRGEKKFGKRLLYGLRGLAAIGKYALNLAGYLKIFVVGISLGAITYYINMLGTLVGPTTVGYILLVAVSIVCHGIFLLLNAHVACVIVSKLQHHEFFRQFYTGGGEAFAPVEPSEEFTLSSTKK